MSDAYRVEVDSMGEVRLPRMAYYGAQTQRAVENFPISGQTLPAELIHALGWVKWAAARANAELGTSDHRPASTDALPGGGPSPGLSGSRGREV
ncbi:MAG: hypothetical protein KatS3mg112_0111 [Thermogutta sp.]|nr:MAG: hypothetical protein KatS3mg112_0111 [Thermogutta sp.]